MSSKPRNLQGRAVLESLQKFEWRFQTLKSDLASIKKYKKAPKTDEITKHRYSVRSSLHDAERTLHHYLSEIYSFKCLVTTLATESDNPEFCGKVKHRRDQYANRERSRVLLGLRHHVQHQNIIPLITRISSVQAGGPWYVVSKKELKRADFEYQKPQMTIELEDREDWFDYFYDHSDRKLVYPFHDACKNWSEIESLREDIYELARDLLQEEISEYVQQLKSLEETRQRISEKEEVMSDILETDQNLTPEISELLTEDIYERVVE